MRRGLWMALLAGVAAGRVASAAEPDGAIADAGRWSHPRGPASGSARSRESMPQSLDVARWQFQPKGIVLAPPVVWDGVAFVLHGSAKEASLAALDVETGAMLGSAVARSPGAAPAPAVWNRAVYVVEGGARLVEFRLKEARLESRWTYDAPGPCGAPRVHGGEIYWAGPSGLLRLRSGGRKPVWTSAGAYAGEPAVFGAHVYSVRVAAGSRSLVAHQRTDGAVVASAELPGKGGDAGIGSVVAAEGVVAVEMAKGGGSWGILAREEKDGKLELRFVREEKLLAAPTAREDRLLALASNEEWALFTPTARRGFVTKAARADLVDGCAAPSSIGGQVCFGTWACDFRTNAILWHLRERDGEPAFASGVRFGAVPGDGLLLLVARDGKTLEAFGAGELGP